jgi:hypothetical protein
MPCLALTSHLSHKNAPALSQRYHTRPPPGPRRAAVAKRPIFALRGPLERREHTPRRPRGACMALLHTEFFLRDVIGPYKTVNVNVSYTLVLCSTCASPFSDSICATTFFVNEAPIATGYNSQECRILQLQKSRQSKSGSGTCVTTQVWCPRCGDIRCHVL